MKTTLTKKQVNSLCSKDDMKPALKGLLYEPDKNRLTATNGKALISYNVESDNGDSCAIIPTDLFKTKLSDSCDYKVNGMAVRESQGNKSEYNLIDQKYPDYENVIPDEGDYDHAEIGINLDLLKSLCEAVPKDDNNNKHIKIIIDVKNPLRAIKFSQTGEDPKYSGVIMPVRL